MSEVKKSGEKKMETNISIQKKGKSTKMEKSGEKFCPQKKSRKSKFSVERKLHGNMEKKIKREKVIITNSHGNCLPNSTISFHVEFVHEIVLTIAKRFISFSGFLQGSNL